MAKDYISQYDTTAGNNTDIGGLSLDDDVQTVDALDDIFGTVMAQDAEFYDDLYGAGTVGGTADAITLTSAIPALADNVGVAFFPTADNTGAATLNVNSLGAKAVRKISGGTDVALAAGDIEDARFSMCVYDSSADSAAGAWILTNLPQTYGDTITLTDTDAVAAAGPTINLYRNSASPADDDEMGEIIFQGENDAGETIDYGRIYASIVDASDASEIGKLHFQTYSEDETGLVDILTLHENKSMVGPVNHRMILNGPTSAGGGGNQFDGPAFYLRRPSTGPVDADFVGQIFFQGKNDAGEDVDYVSWRAEIVDQTDGTEDGKFTMRAMQAGTLATVMEFANGDAIFGTYDAAASGGRGALCSTNSPGSQWAWQVPSDEANNTNTVRGYRGTTQEFRIEADGDVQNTNNSYGSLSDQRLKEYIEDASSQWADIKAMRLHNYTLAFDADDEGNLRRRDEPVRQLGLVAQELEDVSPGLVTEQPNGIKAIKYSILHLKALGALKEAMERIEALESRLDNLER